MTVIIRVNPALGGLYTDGDGSVGNPYRSIYHAWFQHQTAFNAATEDYEFRCEAGVDLNGNDDTGVGFSIDTTSATPRTLLVTVHTPGDRHTAARNTGYRFPTRFATTNVNVNVTVHLVGIAARTIANEGVTGTVAILDDCISFDSPVVQSAGMYCGGGTLTRRNCAVVGSLSEGVLQENNSSLPTVTNINCVAVANTAYGFRQAQGTCNTINCYSGGNGTDAYAGTITKTNCQHSSASVFAGSTASVAYSTANLVNVTIGAENVKLPAGLGSALIGAGVGPASNASVPTVDFEGTVRSGTITDVGIDQHTVTGTTVDSADCCVQGQAIGTLFAAVVQEGSAVGEGFDLNLIFSAAFVLPVTGAAIVTEGQETFFILTQPGVDASIAAEGQDVSLIALTNQVLAVDYGPCVFQGQALGTPLVLNVQSGDGVIGFEFLNLVATGLPIVTTGFMQQVMEPVWSPVWARTL